MAVTVSNLQIPQLTQSHIPSDTPHSLSAKTTPTVASTPRHPFEQISPPPPPTPTQKDLLPFVTAVLNMTSLKPSAQTGSTLTLAQTSLNLLSYLFIAQWCISSPEWLNWSKLLTCALSKSLPFAFLVGGGGSVVPYLSRPELKVEAALS
jgi:hypothetical protein